MRVPRPLWALPAVATLALAGPAVTVAQQRPAAKAPAAAQAADKVIVYKSPT